MTDKNWNVRQSFNVVRLDAQTPAGAAGCGSAASSQTAASPAPAMKSTTLGTNLMSPPNNIGPKSVPNYDALAKAAIYDSTGPRSSPGNATIRSLWTWDDVQLVNHSTRGSRQPRGRQGDLSGMNVHTIAIQVPISQLTKDGKMPATPGDANAVIGAWTTAYRRATRVWIRDGPTEQRRFGPSLAPRAPLVNEVVVPSAPKTVEWLQARTTNSSWPEHQSEAAKLLHLLYGVNVPRLRAMTWSPSS